MPIYRALTAAVFCLVVMVTVLAVKKAARNSADGDREPRLTVLVRCGRCDSAALQDRVRRLVRQEGVEAVVLDETGMDREQRRCAELLCRSWENVYLARWV